MKHYIKNDTQTFLDILYTYSKPRVLLSRASMYISVQDCHLLDINMENTESKQKYFNKVN